MDLQFSLGDTVHRDADKRRWQGSFLSETPRAALEELVSWVRARAGWKRRSQLLRVWTLTRKDDERFADCRTFDDYLYKAIEITAPPEQPKMLMLPAPDPPAPMSVQLRTDYDGEWVDVLRIEQEFRLPDSGDQDDARRVRFWFYRACKAAAETPPTGIAQQTAEWWLSRAECSPRFVTELWDIL